MKITTKVLCRRTKGSLSQTLHLDMSQLGIGTIEGLEHCPKLQSLDVSNNCLEEFENFEYCKHLWRINLSNNKISCLTEFSKIYALGCLDLSNNRIPWKELAYLRNVCIMDLRLHGNVALENDTYYRLHVIDCLPHIWMLDGRLITSAERLQVSQFFQDSALSTRPVRHKLSRNPFKSSTSLNSATVYGDRTCQFARSFPRNESHNSECDKRRLEFMAKNVETDLTLRSSNAKEICNYPINNWLVNLIKYRCDEKERCNMLLLLLIASLEFKVPVDLLRQTVEVAKLNPLFDVDCKKLFDLDITVKIETICLLVSACKLDRDMKGKTEGYFTSGGLYDRLYLCLYHAVAHLLSVIANEGKRCIEDVHGAYNSCHRSLRPHTAPAKSCSSPNKRNVQRQKNDWKVHQRLLGSELVLLLSVVPSFYNYIALKNQSICKLLYTATGDPRLASRLARLTEDLSVDGGDINSLYHEICRSVKRRIQYAAQNISEIQTTSEVGSDIGTVRLNVGKLSENTKEARFILNAAFCYPMRPKSAVLSSGEHLITGRSRPTTTNIIQVRKSVTAPQLTLGSQILLGAQNLARVIALPEQNVALVQMDSVPAPNGSIVVQTRDTEEHYCYVDVNLLEYDAFTGYWKPQGAIGDKITLQAPSLLTESSELSCVDVDKQNLSPQVKQQEIAFVENKQSRKSLRKRNMLSGMKPKLSEVNGSKSFSRSTNESKLYTKKLATPSSVTLGSDENTSATPLRPLSSMFCEKMDLSLSGAVLESGMVPIALADESIEAWAEEPSKSDVHQHSSTFITDTNNFDEDGKKEQQSYIFNPAEGAFNETGLNNLHDKCEINFFPNVHAEIDKNDSNDSQLFDNMQHNVMLPMTITKHDVTQDHANALPNNDHFQDREFTGQTEQIAQNPDGVVVYKNSTKKSTLATIRIPSPQNGISNGIESDIPATENVCETQEENEDYVLHNPTDNKNDNTVIADAAISEELTETRNIENINEAVKWNNDTSVNEQQDFDRKSTRRVQSARVPRSKSIKKSSMASRPYSAVVSRSKHVMFGDNEQDSDSRPGSASSFQLQRTEAWRSSASSGSVALGEGTMPNSFGFHGFSPRTQITSNQQKVKFSVGMHKPPPQRPTSPDQHTDGPTLQTDSNQNVRQNTPEGLSTDKEVFVQKHSPTPKGTTLLASSWLAQGRDVHYEKQQYRRLITSPRLPGYLEGTSMMPAKPRKLCETSVAAPKSDIAVHLLPSRPTKVATKLAQASLKSFERHRLPQSALGGSLAWNKPRFSALQDIKKLTNKPGSSKNMRPSQSSLRRKYT